MPYKVIVETHFLIREGKELVEVREVYENVINNIEEKYKNIAKARFEEPGELLELKTGIIEKQMCFGFYILIKTAPIEIETPTRKKSFLRKLEQLFNKNFVDWENEYDRLFTLYEKMIKKGK